jgi:hypothetical protein
MSITNHGGEKERSNGVDYHQLDKGKKQAIDLDITVAKDETIKQAAEEADIDVSVVYSVRSNYPHVIEQRRKELREEIANWGDTNDSEPECEQLVETVERLAELRSVEGFDMDYEKAFEAILTACGGDES